MRNLGGRPKKVKVEMTEESAMEIMSKVFAESEDLRQKALSFYTKTIKDTRDNSSIALVGKTSAEYLKIAGNATTTKLQIGKIIIDHLSKDNKGKDSEFGGVGETSIDGQKVLTNDVKEQMKKMIEGFKKNTENITPQEKFDKIEKEEMGKLLKSTDNNEKQREH